MILGLNNNVKHSFLELSICKMVLESLKIKNSSYYFWDDTIYLDELDCDLLKLVKRELNIDANVYNIGYIVKKPEYDINSVNPLYSNNKNILGHVEKIDRSDDRYLIIDKTTAEPSSLERMKKVLGILAKMWKRIEDEIISIRDSDKITFGDADKALIKDWNKIRFNSDIDLPLDTSIEFHALMIVINCVIEKGNKYYPEIYLDEGLYVRD